MHEVALMESALEIACEQARLQGAARIHSLTLRIGRLAGVEPDALDFAFEVVTEGTLAAGARLVVETVPAVCFCHACGRTFAPQGFVFSCPDCGQLSSDIRQGRELELTRLEVS